MGRSPHIRPLRPLPHDIDVHPTVRVLYEDALAAKRASEVDILIVAFNLPFPRCRNYLNVLAGERLRGRFDLTEDESSLSSRPTLPRAIWAAAYCRLQAAFKEQEQEQRAAVDRLIEALPPDVEAET